MTGRVGVDGGGTKTECILVDRSGGIMARHLAPGCNPSQVGPERASLILQDALKTLLASHADVSIERTLLCMAGAPLFWREFATGLRGFGEIVTDKDSAAVLELATSGSAGLVLHAGTGSFVAARSSDGTIHYAGGLGWKLGDPGSGFDLGRRAIALALLELQGWGASRSGSASALVAALTAHTGLADYAANSRFFYYDSGANAAIAGFAPRVLELAEQEYGPAQQVVADSITELARLADHVIQQLFASAPVPVACGVSGRILNSVPAAFALRSLATKLGWPVALQFITAPAIEGVRRLLLTERR